MRTTSLLLAFVVFINVFLVGEAGAVVVPPLTEGVIQEAKIQRYRNAGAWADFEGFSGRLGVILQTYSTSVRAGTILRPSSTFAFQNIVTGIKFDVIRFRGSPEPIPQVVFEDQGVAWYASDATKVGTDPSKYGEIIHYCANIKGGDITRIAIVAIARPPVPKAGVRFVVLSPVIQTIGNPLPVTQVRTKLLIDGGYNKPPSDQILLQPVVLH